MTWGMLEAYWKFRQSAVVGPPEKILHFTITETLQIAISECFQLILINDCWPNVMHVEQRILHQGKCTILPTEVANLLTETGSGGGVAPPPHRPLAPSLRTTVASIVSVSFFKVTFMNYFQKYSLWSYFWRLLLQCGRKPGYILIIWGGLSILHYLEWITLLNNVAKVLDSLK